MLDVGCGSGVWGIAIAEADPDARVTAQDLPKVLEQTRKISGAARRCEPIRFSARRSSHAWSFPRTSTIWLCWGTSCTAKVKFRRGSLFKRLQPALKPGGRLAIIDMIPNEERSGPPFPLIFALNMLVHTDGGDTYTFGEYKKWLARSGILEAWRWPISATAAAWRRSSRRSDGGEFAAALTYAVLFAERKSGGHDFRIVAKAWSQCTLGFPAKPGDLALRKLPRGLLDLFHRVFFGQAGLRCAGAIPNSR